MSTDGTPGAGSSSARCRSMAHDHSYGNHHSLAPGVGQAGFAAGDEFTIPTGGSAQAPAPHAFGCVEQVGNHVEDGNLDEVAKPRKTIVGLCVHGCLSIEAPRTALNLTVISMGCVSW